MSSKLVLCGLGNPGEKYRSTRHNLGFQLLDLVCERYGGRWSHPSEYYSLSEINLRGRISLLVKPQRYMNLSGEALVALGEREELSPRRLLVLCDDTALPIGQIRLRPGGGDGGHNGLKSIIYRLGINDFARLRLGIGPVPDGVDPADFVLSDFTGQERETAREMVGRAAECVETWTVKGIETAMNRFNPKFTPGDPDRRDSRSTRKDSG